MAYYSIFPDKDSTIYSNPDRDTLNTGIDEILELAGCDLLTISPKFLEQLENDKSILKRRLSPSQISDIAEQKFFKNSDILSIFLSIASTPLRVHKIFDTKNRFLNGLSLS